METRDLLFSGCISCLRHDRREETREKRKRGRKVDGEVEGVALFTSQARYCGKNNSCGGELDKLTINVLESLLVRPWLS